MLAHTKLREKSLSGYITLRASSSESLPVRFSRRRQRGTTSSATPRSQTRQIQRNGASFRTHAPYRTNSAHFTFHWSLISPFHSTATIITRAICHTSPPAVLPGASSQQKSADCREFLCAAEALIG